MKWYIWLAIILAVFAFSVSVWQSIENKKWVKKLIAENEKEENGKEGNDSNDEEGDTTS